MVEDYTVKITYRNRALESVSQRILPLNDYCREQRQNLMHIIADVETAFYALLDNKSKEDWTPETMEAFQKIRHRILDAANNIERLPRNLYCKDIPVSSMNGSDYIASVIDRYAKEQEAQL